MFFFRQFLRSPCSIGSVCPSSRFLSHTLVEMALQKNSFHPGLIVDLGAGSGVVSRELLKYGVSPERILAVEISENFNKVFNKICPDLELHIGDARGLVKIITTQFPGIPVQAVISSLPLRNMPAGMIAKIMSEVRTVLGKNTGVLIQYTYALWMHQTLEPFGFLRVERRYVPANFPPALVEKYFVRS